MTIDHTITFNLKHENTNSIVDTNKKDYFDKFSRNMI